jgi:hypothetical protein
MAQRRIGPVRGAGVAIVEVEGDKPIEPGALGWAAYAGILEKGPVGELIQCSSKGVFEKKCGSYIDGSLLPDCCYDYFDLARGSGGLLLVRVTDGNEEQSEITLYARKASASPMGKIKAHNGGRWGGKRKKLTGEMTTPATELTETTLDTGMVMKTDEWKGGILELAEVANTTYEIVGNTSAGVVTVVADATMSTDYGSGTEMTYYLSLENEEKALSVEIRDGEDNPDTEFGIFVYVDGDLANSWPNLSTNPASSRYWVDIINDDDNNDEIEVEDLWTGGHDATVRPANHYSTISAVTETVLTADIHTYVVNSPGGGDATMALGTTTDLMVEQVITCTFTDPTTYDVSSDVFGALATGETVGVETDVDLKWVPPFTLTAGGSPMAATDTIVIYYRPFIADELIGGYLYPDKVNAKREKYRITNNDHETITVAAGSDLTASGAPTDEFMVVAPRELSGGVDGIADLADADYENQVWDVANSPFNQIVGKNLGLVKMATPGVTSTAVQKAGIAYADAKNQQYRVEVPSGTVTEDSVDLYLNDTIGRNDFAVCAFPSYGYVPDPLGNNEGKLKLVPLTGMIHGRECRTANDYEGYHKAAAGIDQILPSILKLPTGDAILDEEYLNPIGVAVIKKVKGNFIIWGDRTLHVDPNWRWKHQREQMCYYENVLRESFDWIIFQINDPRTEKMALTSLKTFFVPEWVKRALQGSTFEEAAIIKCDSELNTPAVRAAGNMKCQISLWLADTVERFIIEIGKQGIFEAVAA